MKLCECGCGAPTRLAPQTRTERGWVKGEPVRFVNGHQLRTPRTSLPEYVIDPATGCWLWQRQTVGNGYGHRQIGADKAVAHRHAYERVHGPVPPGHDVHHRCEHPGCVNPDHLELVTRLEHARLHAPKLTLEKACEIRARARSGEPYRDIAADYGISRSMVSEIKAERTWRAPA